MKQLTIIGVVLLSWISGGVMADCSSTQVTNIASLLDGMTIDATSPGGENWKEQHTGGAGGTLYKVGQGCGDPVDGTVPVGTWNVSGTGAASRAVYSYTGDTNSPYSWSVHDNGGTYTFCDAPGGNEIATGTLSSNAAPCSP